MVPVSVNAKGSQFCQQVANVFQRFPFNARSNTDASPADFVAVFQPGGLLAMFYQNSLQDLLVPAGAQFTKKAGGRVSVRAEFLTFFNKAMMISHAFFPATAGHPSLAYTIRALPSNEIESFTLRIGGKELKKFDDAQEFLWNGETTVINLTVKPRNGSSLTAPARIGPWALFHFLSEADRTSAGGTVYEYDISDSASIGRRSVTTSAAGVLRFQVEAKGASGLFASFPMGCVARVGQ